MYDIANCGQKNRFVANGYLVHNSGGDKLNLQNMPRKGPMRNSLVAPPGYEVVAVDSANIEARVLDMLAGQEDAVEVYRKNDAGLGPDVYCVMAAALYGYEVIKGIHNDERQLGKVVKLGCGFGVGPEKFIQAAKMLSGGKLILPAEEAQRAVEMYRAKHPMVKRLWRACDKALVDMQRGAKVLIGATGLVHTVKDGIMRPNGLVIKYPELRERAGQWEYRSGREYNINIYGAKVVENIVQALARDIVMDQSKRVAQRCKVPWVLSVHDEGVFLARVGSEAEDVRLACAEEFRRAPTWWPDLPLNMEVGVSPFYGQC